MKKRNLNIGILGHVDSGKTSLAKALSSTASTAAFDKNPQSQERGITLDLGFSSFTVPAPPHLAEGGYEEVQFTLVDCPGHASLIRTIIGGAQIIDMMLLVVDVVKGIQTQTAECIVIGEMTCDNLIVVLNKVDLLPEEGRAAAIEKVKKRVSKALECTKFGPSVPMVPVAAYSQKAAEESSASDKAAASSTRGMGLDDLVSEICSRVRVPTRDATQPFLMAVDHCFPIKGQGTVMTGTVLAGKVSVNDTVEVPELKIERKVKSMQMFHKSVESASQGDRVGICVTQVDAKSMERGLICAQGTVPTFDHAIARISKVKFFKMGCQTKSKLHVTIGHTTVMAVVTFFCPEAHSNPLILPPSDVFSFDREYLYVDSLDLNGASTTTSGASSGDSAATPAAGGSASTSSATSAEPSCYVLLHFETPVTAPPRATLIASRLDTDIHHNVCRLAFSGQLLHVYPLTETAPDLSPLKIFKKKTKQASIDRIVDSTTLIGKNLVKPGGDLMRYMNVKLALPSGEVGVVESSFGKTGKFKVQFRSGNLGPTTQGPLTMYFKRYVFDSSKKIYQ